MSSAQDVLNLQTAKQAHFDNAGYRTTTSVTMARAFATACHQLIGLLPKSGQHGGTGGEAYSFDHASLLKQAQEAEAYASKVAANSVAGSQITHTDFSNFRR